ncbi:MAG: hypothetical protein A2509_06245 [Candidatus Edwardsbacteria bacterium RIFOXYD12_FULL_50_11]|uniref:DUF4145 domain-containing protein n=1 Tax=Candidatus Edwardsbacteria bacterium GWF2_54_11 TaxID=1817851 RepID=A0A1F5R336_9BACT|nr:MAG: hypothetical protein A2502_10370 [Candidatus Edwardsbacteria bacterium RifOxyC12_full_54_24]OGF06758.1 MAG: hypothetical protein A2273_00690 [Candidatus Edwardsbacteria bacterium RifOxyA12_full_54_48]OGF08826.1 MAG: hypothetical protein A2024_00955 [Candidatus Edwardsbacteria bacterium GWF2_54_11]OGF10709.1 MAG: hypothetical protein A3K15_06055 [Candidatus Edwardsbacteria bacterium GWE2_54_12]OGF15491.1 MAG: hypothetical protein A2509_06245 [Candidatus Edwardsbacteria bacterium RIFOXYD1
MDVLTFIVEIIKAIIWPVTIVLLFFTFKEKIANLLQYLQKLKYKDFELEFQQSMKELVNETANAKLPIPSQGEDEKKNQVLALIDLSPRSAILEAWLEVESAAAESLVGVNKVFYEHTYISPLQLSGFLVRSEILDDKKAAIFGKLRNLRNMAVHSPDIKFPINEVREYIDLAFSLSKYIRDKNYK